MTRGRGVCQCIWCEARDTVSMAISDRHQQTQQLIHTPGTRNTPLINELKLLRVNIPILLDVMETVFLITYCPVLSRSPTCAVFTTLFSDSAKI